MQTCKHCGETNPTKFNTRKNKLCTDCGTKYIVNVNKPKTYIDYLKESGQYDYYKRHIRLGLIHS